MFNEKKNKESAPPTQRTNTIIFGSIALGIGTFIMGGIAKLLKGKKKSDISLAETSSEGWSAKNV